MCNDYCFTGPDQEASGQTTYVDSELGGDSGFFFGFDPIPPGVDVNPFPDIGSLGPDLDGLVTKDDQLYPGLSDAEGTHISHFLETDFGGVLADLVSFTSVGVTQVGLPVRNR